MQITHRVHGIPFHRIGECNRCPDIHPAPCCGDCEYSVVVDGVNTCLTYPECPKYSNELREAFPDHPWLRVIREGLCNYEFIRLDEDGEVDDTPLPFVESWR